MSDTAHTPVLLTEVLERLSLTPGMIVVDATLGGGGYTQALLERVLPTGQVIAFDWDQEALQRFEQRIVRDEVLKRAFEAGQLSLIHESYAELKRVLEERHLPHVDAIVADLGFSTDQIENPDRGLSFQTDGPLDMRLNSSEKVTAADILREWDVDKLSTLFATYGDEPESHRIARAIVVARATNPLLRTSELASLIKRTVSGKRRFGRIHPATQVFQALRIAVNSERAHLEQFLGDALHLLKGGGKLACVAFHSGEDALVKHFFQKEARGCTCGMQPCLCGRTATLRILTKKPVTPSEKEVRENPRARSAKLRVAEKID